MCIRPMPYLDLETRYPKCEIRASDWRSSRLPTTDSAAILAALFARVAQR